MLATTLLEGFTAINPGVQIVGLLATGMTIVWVTSKITQAWRKVRQSESRTALVGMMLQRGMSAEDIERVMKSCIDPSTTNDGDNLEARVITLLKENEYEADDIERILDLARIEGHVDLRAVEIIETLVEQESDGNEIERMLRARLKNKFPQRAAV